MRRQFKIGIVAIVLSLVMFLQSFPTEVLSVLADGLSELITTETTTEKEFYTDGMVDTYNIGNSYIVQENIENRTSTSKEYLMSDDTIMVQQFIEPVHYLQEGQYREIDNTLIEEDVAGESVLKNKANSFNVSFNKTAKLNNTFVEIEQDGDVLSLGYNLKSDKEINGQVKNVAGLSQEKSESIGLERPNTIKNGKGQISYASIEENTDIAYEVSNAKLTKEIVIKKQQEKYEYSFVLKSKSLQYAKTNAGNINISDIEGKIKFVMTAPYMIDGDGNYSDAVVYTLSGIRDGVQLTVSADAKWINKQSSFPITINATLKSAQNDNFNYASVSEEGQTITSLDKIYAGKRNEEKRNDVFMNFTLPEVPSYYQLIGTSVNFGYETKGMGGLKSKDLKYNVYVAESTENLSNITYLEKPQKIQELNGITKTSEFIEKELEYKSDIINPYNLKNNTLTLAIETAEGTSNGGYITLSAEDNVETIYWYQRVIGIKDNYSMESFSINGATSYINNGTGYLTSVIDLASVNTLSDMPFAASLVYNDFYDQLLNDIAEEKNITIPSVAGPCFKLNFQQFMIQNGNAYELIDADGSISTFNYCSSNEYYSKDKKLYCEFDAVGKAIVSDLLGNQMHFDNKGRLTKIISENNQAEYINVLYTTTNGYEISKVEYYANWSKKYTIEFTYTSGKLTTVKTLNGSSVMSTLTLQYNNEDNLTGITKSGVQLLTFTYYARYVENKIVEVIDSICDNQHQRLYFERVSEHTIIRVDNYNYSSTGGLRRNSYVNISYYGTYTKIYYYENNIMTNGRYVSFNNTKEVISEWQQDDRGIFTVQATTNWKNLQGNGTNDYEKETVSYYHKSLAANSTPINPNGGKFEQTVDASALGVDNNDNYTFAVVFNVFTSDGGSEFEAGINLSVKIGDSTAQNIVLTYGGSTYIAIPCEYLTNTKVTITNKGTDYVGIRYFSYQLVNYMKESYVYDSSIGAHNLGQTETSFRSGDVSVTTYDAKQRIEEIEKEQILTGASIETTQYTYFDNTNSVIKKGKIQQIQTTKTNEDTETVLYDYSGSWANYTETVTTTIGGNVTRSVNNIYRNGNTTTITQTDENNIQTVATYTELNGDIRLSEIVNGNTKETYTYNSLGVLTNINVYDTMSNTMMYSQTDNYDENGIYLGSTYGGITYTYGYDNTGYVTSIGHSGAAEGSQQPPLIQYLYESNGNLISSNRMYRKTYANGNQENYNYTTTTMSGKTAYKTQVSYKNSASGSTIGTYEYNTNANGQVLSQSYKRNGNTQVSYNYGQLDNLEQKKLTISSLEFYTEYTKNYDTLNNRIESSQLFSMIGCSTMDSKVQYYSYNDDGQISKIRNGGITIEYEYDNMGRLVNKTSPYSYYSNLQEEEYLYKTYSIGTNVYTTNQLLMIDDKTYENNDRSATYYANGYVESVSYNGNTYGYEYDGAGRLIKESKNGVVKAEYSYDSSNNVKTKKVGQTETTYNHDSYNRLVGNEYAYDAMGNPTTYKGNTFAWEQGRKLASGSMDGKSFTYLYDGNGMRYEKTVSGTTTSYYYDGTQLLMESKNGQRIWYIYGVTGIEGIIHESGYNQETYYFDKNTLGDIVAIRNDDGNIVATYEYDAWGNVTVMDNYGYENTNSLFIGNVNPIRYRGYYYDDETGFYYLQTRYYDPTICRFINADNYELIAELSCVAGQLNMYAYCGNNPIMYTDGSGESALATTLIVLGVLLFTPVGGAVAQVATSAVSYVGMAAVAGVDYLINGGNGVFYQDMSAIGWNPFNAKVDNVMNASKISFYKGVPVFLKNSGRSGSFYAISLNINDGTTGLNHERGHNWQAMMMGIINYGLAIGIPSLYELGNWSAQGGDNYYRAPWEITADLLGGVNRSVHTKADIELGWKYFSTAVTFFSGCYLYLL